VSVANGDDTITKIFVGNLSFDIDDAQIKEVFKECGEIVNIEWFNSREGQFRGCGILEFDSAAAAQKALGLAEKEVLGRPMKVNLNKPKTDRPERDRGRGRGDRGARGRGGAGAPRTISEKPEGCTTVFLGNLSWNINDDNIHEVFAECGTIEKIRWVEREGKFAGIGFVQFSETEATDKAVKLAGTEVLGRPLRVDYAADRKKPEY